MIRAYSEKDILNEARRAKAIERWRSDGPGFRFTIEHRRAGQLLSVDVLRHNLIHSEGEEALLSAYFATSQAGFGAPPANLYLGLRTNSIAQGDTLASGLTELAGTGYARIALSTTTAWTLSQVTDWRATFGSQVFTAGGAWSGITGVFVCTVSSGTAGKLISSVATSATRNLISGDTLTVSGYITLSN